LPERKTRSIGGFFYFYFIGNFRKAGDTYLMSKRNHNPDPEDRLATVKDVRDIVSGVFTHDVTRIVNEAFKELAIMMMRGFDDINDRMVTKVEFNEFKEGVYEFKEEMTLFKHEMYEFKDEMYEFRDNMLEFKNSMTDFRNNMLEFKNDTEPVLFSLQTDMMEVKRRLVKIEDETLEIKEEAVSLRRATIMTLRNHETRICAVENNPSS
jgi:hypothetical protein